MAQLVSEVLARPLAVFQGKNKILFYKKKVIKITRVILGFLYLLAIAQTKADN